MELVNVFAVFGWSMNLIGLVLIVATRAFRHTKAWWAAIGCTLVLIALGNVGLFVAAGANPSQQAASIFGLVVLGSLGSRFIGNWITDGAT